MQNRLPISTAELSNQTVSPTSSTHMISCALEKTKEPSQSPPSARPLSSSSHSPSDYLSESSHRQTPSSASPLGVLPVEEELEHEAMNLQLIPPPLDLINFNPAPALLAHAIHAGLEQDTGLPPTPISPNHVQHETIFNQANQTQLTQGLELLRLGRERVERQENKKEAKNNQFRF